MLLEYGTKIINLGKQASRKFLKASISFSITRETSKDSASREQFGFLLLFFLFMEQPWALPSITCSFPLWMQDGNSPFPASRKKGVEVTSNQLPLYRQTLKIDDR